MKALVVDDEQEICLMISKILLGEEIQSTCANSLAEAAKIISKQVFDIYFLDLNLTDGSGFDLVPIIRSTDTKAEIAIISAYDGSEEMNKVSELQINHFIKKPFSKKDVLFTVALLKSAVYGKNTYRR